MSTFEIKMIAPENESRKKLFSHVSEWRKMLAENPVCLAQAREERYTLKRKLGEVKQWPAQNKLKLY